MEQIRTKVKKWGNSFGIIIPKEIISREGLKEDNEVFVTVQPKKYTTVGDIMELAKKFKIKRKSKKSTQEVMDEIDREFWPEDE
ncbi:AbrB/MazE/SpoVT family DNA-binding domain-containing protein [Candidatus Pacearchaeota archaeon]|nr:AbrB/MazE/SpoVT family DNA-binding domain-containing protein [Candidatus Pacearchaeota archaeon]